MNFFGKLLWLPYARRKVHASVLGNFKGILESDLEMHGIKKRIELTDALLDRLVREAYERAAEGEPDGIPRYSQMWAQIDNVSKSVVLVCDGNKEADGAIRSILLHHGARQPT
jgi:hypothetical protein